MSPPASDWLEFRRLLPGSPQQIYALWTEPAAIRRWFGGADTRVGDVELDVRAGGQYRIEVETEAGPSAVSGRFLEVEAPYRLRYTWTFSSIEGTLPETTVEVQFRASQDGTEIVLSHGPFPDEGVRELHSSGWEACFAAMETIVHPEADA